MKDPIILIGNGRSGTSILGQLMRDHLGVAFGTESQFIVTYFRRLGDYGVLDVDSNLRKLVGDILQERWFQRSRKFSNFGVGLEEVLSNVKEKTYSGVLDAIFELFAKHLGMDRWGDKTPSYIDHLDVIHELFPNAKYVHLVRDGRDVALSLSKIYFGPKNVYTAALRWRDTIDKGDRFCSTLPAGKVLNARYEDMLSDPRAFFQTLMEFLQIARAEQQRRLDSILNHAGLKQDNCNKWRKELRRSQLHTFEYLAASQLRRHGYETITSLESSQGSAWAHRAWKLHDEISKWRFRKYWADNAYKAKLTAITAYRKYFRRFRPSDHLS